MKTRSLPYSSRCNSLRNLIEKLSLIFPNPQNRVFHAEPTNDTCVDQKFSSALIVFDHSWFACTLARRFLDKFFVILINRFSTHNSFSHWIKKHLKLLPLTVPIENVLKLWAKKRENVEFRKSCVLNNVFLALFGRERRVYVHLVK